MHGLPTYKQSITCQGHFYISGNTELGMKPRNYGVDTTMYAPDYNPYQQKLHHDFSCILSMSKSKMSQLKNIANSTKLRKNAKFILALSSKSTVYTICFILNSQIYNSSYII